jgi:hypothetical protein
VGCVGGVVVWCVGVPAGKLVVAFASFVGGSLFFRGLPVA